jgi:hypothetical protein
MMSDFIMSFIMVLVVGCVYLFLLSSLQCVDHRDLFITLHGWQPDLRPGPPFS